MEFQLFQWSIIVATSKHSRLANQRPVIVHVAKGDCACAVPPPHAQQVLLRRTALETSSTSKGFVLC